MEIEVEVAGVVGKIRTRRRSRLLRIPRTMRRCQNINYYWTHGVVFGNTCKSTNCSWPVGGHKTGVNFVGNKGGSQSNKNLVE